MLSHHACSYPGRKLNRQSELWDAASPLFSPVHNLSRRQLVLDVLPTLGTICFSEQNRQEAKAKRRLGHTLYLAVNLS